jgi:hypothetical protein
MFFDSFLVGKNGYENLSFFVTKYIGNFNNLTDLKIMGKCYNFLTFFWTEVIERIKYVCDISHDNKCYNFRSQKLQMHVKNVSNFFGPKQEKY